MRFMAVVVVVVAFFTMLSSTAFAAESEKPPTREWYGWQTFAADGAAVALVITGIKTEQSSISMMGIGTYALAPPVIHATHGKAKIALADVGIRVGAPVGGAAAGFGIGWVLGGGLGGRNSDSLAPLALGAIFGLTGAVFGYLGAVMVDACALAYDDAPSSSSSSSARRAAATPRNTIQQMNLSPTFAFGKNGNTIGLAGTF